MEVLENGTKVVVFTRFPMGKEDKVNIEFVIGTIIEGYEGKDYFTGRSKGLRYSVKCIENQEERIYNDCHYFDDFMTIEDYRKYLSNEMIRENYWIKNHLNNCDKMLKKIVELDSKTLEANLAYQEKSDGPKRELTK